MENTVEVLELPLIPGEKLSYFSPVIETYYGKRFNLENYLESKVVLGKDCKLNLGLYDKNGRLQYLFIDNNFEVTKDTPIPIHHPYFDLEFGIGKYTIIRVCNKSEILFFDNVIIDYPNSIYDLKNMFTKRLASLLNRYEEGWGASIHGKSTEGFKLVYKGLFKDVKEKYKLNGELEYCVLVSINLFGREHIYVIGY